MIKQSRFELYGAVGAVGAIGAIGAVSGKIFSDQRWDGFLSFSDGTQIFFVLKIIDNLCA